MDNIEYGVKITNKFAIIDEALDPSEILSQLEAAAAKSAKEDKAAQKKKQQAKKSSSSTESSKKLPTTPASGVDKQQKSTTVAASLKKASETKENVALDKENKPIAAGGGRGAGRGFGGGPQRPPRGRGGITTGEGGEQRRPPYDSNRPRQDRPNNLPPRFNRDSNEGNENYQQTDEQRYGSRGRGEGRGRGRGGRGGGFGRGGPGGFSPRVNDVQENGPPPPRAASGFGGFGSGAVAPQQMAENETKDAAPPVAENEESDVKTGGFGGFPPSSEEQDDTGRYRGGFRNRTFNRGGYRGSRGGFGGRNQADYRGRQFERQSGSDRTGVKSMDKREGGGAYNWGTAQDELVGESETTNVNVSDETGGENEEKGEVRENATAEELEPKQLTLDEWKALQEPRSKPEFNVRRPGEGESDDIKKIKLLPLKPEPKPAKKKKVKDEKQQNEKIAADEDEEEERLRKTQNAVDIVIKFTDEPSRGGGRPGGGPGGRRGGGGFRQSDEGGNRGRFGGGFGRGGGGGGGGAQSGEERSGGGRREVPFKMDEETFPTLS